MKEADQLSEHVLLRRRQILGRHHPNTLSAQGQRSRIEAERWREHPEKLEEIVQTMQVTLDVARRALSEGHLGGLAGKKWFAEVLMLQGALQKAENLRREAAEKKEYAKASDIDSEHPDRPMHEWKLAQCLERMGKTKEALDLCREPGVNILLSGVHGLGANHRMNARLLQKIADLECKLREEVEK